MGEMRVLWNSSIINSRLTSITLVRDYIMLEFHGKVHGNLKTKVLRGNKEEANEIVCLPNLVISEYRGSK